MITAFLWAKLRGVFMTDIPSRVAKVYSLQTGKGGREPMPTLSTKLFTGRHQKLDQMEFIMNLEDEFTVSIEDDEGFACTTLLDYIKLMEGLSHE